MPRMTKKRYAVLAGIGAVALTAGAAFAYWTSAGSGTGTATTGTDTPWAVTIDSTNLQDLTPNGPTETVTFHVQNAGSGVQNLVNTVASVTGTSAGAGCTAADFSVSGTTITYGSVPAGNTVNGTFTLKMIDTGVPQNGCKSVTVNLKVDAS